MMHSASDPLPVLDGWEDSSSSDITLTLSVTLSLSLSLSLSVSLYLSLLLSLPLKRTCVPRLFRKTKMTDTKIMRKLARPTACKTRVEILGSWPRMLGAAACGDDRCTKCGFVPSCERSQTLPRPSETEVTSAPPHAAHA